LVKQIGYLREVKELADALPDTPVQQSTATSSTEDKIEGPEIDVTLTILWDCGTARLE
jgi:hypothetical protein